MPTYVFRCEKCGTTFERSEHVNDRERTHACPRCGSDQVSAVLTPFFAKTAKKS